MSDKARRVGDERDMADRVRDLEARLEEMEHGSRIRERAQVPF